VPLRKPTSENPDVGHPALYKLFSKTVSCCDCFEQKTGIAEVIWREPLFGAVNLIEDVKAFAVKADELR